MRKKRNSRALNADPTDGGDAVPVNVALVKALERLLVNGEVVRRSGPQPTMHSKTADHSCSAQKQILSALNLFRG